jgi:predicted nuclease of predicted toxin-antitoxin system
LIKFLADESCDFAVVRALRAAGYDVLAVSERSPGAHDDDVIGLAASERRILLTEDKDFGQLVFAAGKETCGVIFIRYPAGLRSELPQRVLDAVKREGARMQTAFAVLQPKRLRISGLPKGERSKPD